MIDDSLKSHPAQLSEIDANFLASLLMGEPEPSPVLGIAKSGDFVLDLRDSNPTLTFDPKTGMAEMLGGNDKARVSDLVDVGAVLAAKPSAAVIARSVFGQPEPSALAIVPETVRQGPVIETEPSHGTSQGWFHPATPVAAAAATAGGEDLFTPTPEPAPRVTVRLDTATKTATNGDEVVFSAAAAAADRRRRFMLVALFLGALAIGGGLVALIVDNSLLSGSTNQPDPAAEIVTTVAPTTVAPTTAAPTTAVPTTAVPTTAVPTTAIPTTVPPTTVAPTTAAPTTTVPPTTQAPATTAAPTTRAPRTTSRPATTRPPATSPPTTAAPTVTFAPPTWAEPLE